jgi:spermidine/putrescine transport system substrate-binding protein
MRTRLLTLLLLMFILSAPAAAQTDFWACPRQFQGQTLNVYNWTTYIAEDTISNFERLCGVTVIYNTYASDGDMLEELRAGNTPAYDVVVPSNANVYLMVAEGLLQPLDFGSIPNFANVGENFKNPPYDPGNRYTVPYQWGTIGVGYNRTALGRDINTWDEIFKVDARVAWLDEARPMFGFALRVLGFDPNTGDANQIAAAEQYLIDHRANLVAIAPDTGQDLLAAGQADIVVEYNGDIFQLIAACGCDDYRYIIPQEGGQIWTDNLAIPVGARNKALAETFIDYILNAQVNADISNYTAYASPNQVAISEGLIYGDYLSNTAIYPQETGSLFYTVTDAALDEAYGAAWERVHRAAGQ